MFQEDGAMSHACVSMFRTELSYRNASNPKPVNVPDRLTLIDRPISRDYRSPRFGGTHNDLHGTVGVPRISGPAG